MTEVETQGKRLKVKRVRYVGDDLLIVDLPIPEDIAAFTSFVFSAQTFERVRKYGFAIAKENSVNHYYQGLPYLKLEEAKNGSNSIYGI